MGPIEQSVLDNLMNVKVSIENIEGQFASLKAQLDRGIEAIDDVYNEGFEAGKASVVPGEGSGPVNPGEPSDKIYSQVQVDEMLAAAKVESDGKIAAMQVELDSVKADLEVLKNDMASKVEEQVAAYREVVKAKLAAQQEIESASEKALAEDI